MPFQMDAEGMAMVGLECLRLKERQKCLTLLSPFSADLEVASVLVLLYLEMNRLDLAHTHIDKMMAADCDSVLCNLSNAYVLIHAVFPSS